MVPAAPRIDARLVRALKRLDDGRTPIAEINRRIGALAAELGLVRPSYERVRVVLHELRWEAAQPSTADVLLDVAFRVRPPTSIGDHLAGTLPPRRRR